MSMPTNLRRKEEEKITHGSDHLGVECIQHTKLQVLDCVLGEVGEHNRHHNLVAAGRVDASLVCLG